MLWVALTYRNNKGNLEWAWEMMIQLEIQQVTSNLQETKKGSRNIIIIPKSYFCVLFQGLNSSGVGYWIKGAGLYLL